MWLKPSVAGNDNNEYIYFSSPHAIPDASRGLVGLWHLDNSTQDSSGQGKHGTAVGGTNCAPTVTGKFGTACSFDGVNDNISLSQVIPIANKNYTVSAWVNKANNTTNHAILDGLWFSLQFRKSTIVMFHVNETGWKSFTLNVGTVPENEWHYISVVHDYNTGWSIYFDGVFKGVSGKVGYYSTYTPNSIGSALGSNDRGGQWLNGTVDEVAIWNRSLSAQEIKEQALGLSLYKNTTNMLNFHVGNETLGYSTTSWSANDWHHIAGTWSTSEANLYVDGASQTSVSAISLPNNFTEQTYIGNNAWQHNATNGTIDELMIYNRTLSSAEIYQHYTAGAGRYMQYRVLFDTLDTNMTPVLQSINFTQQNYQVPIRNRPPQNVTLQIPINNTYLANNLTTLQWNAFGAINETWANTTGLVGLWHLDNSTADSSGLGHVTTSGNVSGLGKANCSTAVNGKFGTACSFGTTDADIINISIGSSLLNNSGSLEMWLKPNVAGSDNNEYIYFSSPHAIPDASRGLVGLWNLDNSTQDSSGMGNHGIAVNGTNCSTTVSGKFGTACSFDGVNDVISMGTSPQLDNFTNFTFSQWVKFNGLPEYQQTVGRGPHTEGGAWFIMIAPAGTKQIYLWRTSGPAATWSYTFKTGVWYYIVMVRSGSTITTYINSASLGTQTYGTILSNSDQPFRISVADPSGRFVGTIDEVAIWNRSLSAQEIKEQALGLSLYKNTTNTLNFHIGNETLGYATSSWSANDWHHITGTWSTSGANLYVDGSLQTTKTSISLPNNFTDSAYIGNNAWQHNATNGTIDEVAIWNRSLSEYEIRDQYYRGRQYYELLIDNDANFSSPEVSRLAINNFTQPRDSSDAWNEDDDYTVFTEHFESATLVVDNGGTLMGNPAFTKGRFGNAISLNGSGAWVNYTLQNDMIRASTDKFTEELWFKWSGDTGNIEPILSQERTHIGIGNGNEGTTNNKLFTYIGGSALNGATTLSTGTWYSAAVTYDNTQVILYLNGIEETRGTRTLGSQTGTNIKVGANNTNFFNGSIDELRISSIARTPYSNISSTTFTVPSQLANGRYFWKVRALDVSNETYAYREYYSPWSEVYNFTVNTFAPTISNAVEYNQSGIQITGATEVAMGKNLTINVTIVPQPNAPIDKVWIEFWHMVNGVATIVATWFMSLVDAANNIWSATGLINASFPTGEVNYTIYSNDTLNNTASFQGAIYVDATAPTITFIAPKDTNNSYINRTYTVINVSINELSLDKLWLQWNGEYNRTLRPEPVNETWYNTSGLVGLWHLDNSTQDSSGLGHATTSGNVSGLGKANCSTSVSGKFGTACSF